MVLENKRRQQLNLVTHLFDTAIVSLVRPFPAITGEGLASETMYTCMIQPWLANRSVARRSPETAPCTLVIAPEAMHRVQSRPNDQLNKPSGLTGM